MLLLGIDLETSGLDPKEDRIIEIGVVLWDGEAKKPLLLYSGFCWDDTYAPISEEITRITGISQNILETYGHPVKFHMEKIKELLKDVEISYLVGHNGRDFDRLFLETEECWSGENVFSFLPWIDTMQDIPGIDRFESRKLKYLSLDHGLMPHMGHRALFDVCTMLEILAKYEINEVIEQSLVPNIKVRLLVPPPWDDNGVGRDTAKANGFRWDPSIKGWVKTIKENKFEIEKEKLSKYQLVQLKKDTDEKVQD